MDNTVPRSLPTTRRSFLLAGGVAGTLLALTACGVPTAPPPPTAAPAAPTTAAPAAAKPAPTSAPSQPAAAPANAPAAAAPTSAAPKPTAATTSGNSVQGGGSTIDWQAYKGKTVHYIWTNDKATISGMTPVWNEFEKLTGMTLKYEGLGTTPQRQKIELALVAKDPSLDGFGMQVSQQGRQYFENKWLEPLTPFISNPGLTDASWDYKDFGAGALSASLIPDPDAQPGLTLPATAQSQVLYYRKDLFEQAGLKPPTTLDEMQHAAQALSNPSKQQYGITVRGLGHDATTHIGTYLYSLGGKWVGDDGRLAIDTPEMLKTLQFYGGLMHQYGPPGASGLSSNENAALVQQGQVAMMSELNNWEVIFNDPKQSPKVAGKMAISYIPRGPVAGPVPGGNFIMIPVQNFAISPFSKNKEATWCFLQWLANKQNFVRRLLTGQASPRQSSWASTDFLDTSAAKDNPDWVKVSLGAAQYGRNWVSPPILAVDEFRGILGKAIDAAVAGQPIPPALKTAQAGCDDLLKRTEPAGHKLVDWSKLPT